MTSRHPIAVEETDVARTIRPMAFAHVGLLVAAVAAVTIACSTPAAPVSATATPAATAPPTVTVSPGPSLAAEPSPLDVADGPPEATLAAEGGDPVAGALGTYAWGDAGSDSPWLRGSPIAVGAGEPLTVAVADGVRIAAWWARYVRSSASDPTGATALGDGAGLPTFAAPPAGSWTVEVHVTFAEGLGDATYFWRLEVG
jgi:hypothetical protein